MTEKYPLAEKFIAPQGEGLYTGTQIAFVRMVGCSVGQKVCHACDTDFVNMRPDLGGGVQSVEEIVAWATTGARRVCITGGEPFDRDIRPLIQACLDRKLGVSVETSGTIWPRWLDPMDSPRQPGKHIVLFGESSHWVDLWVTVSPKPGFTESMIDRADEVKVILQGLGDGPGWPTVEQARSWAERGKLVYIQPRNGKLDVDMSALTEALEVVAANPTLRLSVQLHKFVRTR